MKKIIAIFATAFCVIANAQTYQWAKGIGNATVVTQSNDFAHCVTTDLAGNVYMTGRFLGTNVDFNPGFGSVNLTSGTTFLTNDVFFAKYSAGGNCIWAKGTTGTQGTGYSMATDAAGNVYITGVFSVPGDFDPGPGVAMLNVYGNGFNSQSIFIAKYDSGGNYLWANAFSLGFGMGIGLDATGNVYVTGNFQGTNVDFDPGPGIANLSAAAGSDAIFFAKYNTNGNYLWAKAINGTAYDNSYSISVDPAGNSYITGHFGGANVDFDPGPGIANLTSAGSGADIFFAKYDTNCNYVWAKSIFGSGSGLTTADGYSIHADASGNIFLTGIFFGVSVDFDPGPGVAILSAGPTAPTPPWAMFFAKYDANGNYLWAKSVTDANAKSVTSDALGKVYVTGVITANSADLDPGPGTATLGPGVFFAKYDAVGNYVWAKSISAGFQLPNYFDSRNSIAVDLSGNVYIAGRFAGTNVDFDPGPATASLSAPAGKIYLAKYAYCSSQVNNPQLVCPGSCYAINGHCYTTNGIYNDTLYSAFGCDSIVVTQLTVSGQAMNLTITSSSVLCSGSSNTLTASGAATYTWSNGTQNPVIVVMPTNVGQYVVTGTSSGGGCTGSAIINVLLTPMLSISGNQTVCVGEQVIITANGANSYTWSTGAQTQSILTVPTVATVYIVTGSSANTACKSQQTYAVYVMPCLSIKSYASGEIQISVYPNPSKTELFYTVNNNGSHRYAITDLSGRLLAEGEQRGSKVRLDLAAYQPGLYIFTITVGKTSKSTRFLIE